MGNNLTKTTQKLDQTLISALYPGAKFQPGHDALVAAWPSEMMIRFSAYSNPVKNSSPAKSSSKLGSWKEIAAYLEVTVRTAQRWEKERGLPIHRRPGPRGRIEADPRELQAWQDGTFTARRAPVRPAAVVRMAPVARHKVRPVIPLRISLLRDAFCRLKALAGRLAPRRRRWW
jgi:hypothetical protein